MKKRILVTVMAMTMVTGMLAGCGSKTQTETAEATVEEAVEETTEASTEKAEAVEEATEEVVDEAVSEDSVEEVAEEKEPIEMLHYDELDLDFPSRGEGNIYVQKIADAGIDLGAYEDAVLIQVKDGWFFYNAPTEETLDLGINDYGSLTEEEGEAWANEFKHIANGMIENQSDKLIDLDDDGTITYAEAYMVSIFANADQQKKPYGGAIAVYGESMMKAAK